MTQSFLKAGLTELIKMVSAEMLFQGLRRRSVNSDVKVVANLVMKIKGSIVLLCSMFLQISFYFDVCFKELTDQGLEKFLKNYILRYMFFFPLPL